MPGINPNSSVVTTGLSKDAGTPASTANFASAITSLGSRLGAKSKVGPVYIGSLAFLDSLITNSGDLLGAKSNVTVLLPAIFLTEFSIFFTPFVDVSDSQNICSSVFLGVDVDKGLYILFAIFKAEDISSCVNCVDFLTFKPILSSSRISPVFVFTFEPLSCASISFLDIASSTVPDFLPVSNFLAI